MNTFAKIMIAEAATLATAVGTARIVSKVAKDQDDAFFTEHAENGVGLGGGFDLGSINHFSKAPTNVPEAEPVQDVAFEDENGQFIPLPEAEEPPAEPVTAPAEEVPEEPTPEVEETPVIEEVPEEAVPLVPVVPALEAPETEAPAEEEPETEEEPVAEETVPVEEPTPVKEAEPVEEPAPAEEETPAEEELPVEEPTLMEESAPEEDHFEDIYSDSAKEEEAAQQEVTPASQEPAASPKKKKGSNTIQVGNAIVSDDSSNGFIELVAQESGKAPEQLVVLASPKASLMVFSFSDAEHRTENTLDAIYFVSEKGKVTESSAEERENVMAFARTFISHNQEFKNFLLR